MGAVLTCKSWHALGLSQGWLERPSPPGPRRWTQGARALLAGRPGPGGACRPRACLNLVFFEQRNHSPSAVPASVPGTQMGATWALGEETAIRKVGERTRQRLGLGFQLPGHREEPASQPLRLRCSGTAPLSPHPELPRASELPELDTEGEGSGGACSGGDRGEQGQGCGGYTCLGSCSPQ